MTHKVKCADCPLRGLEHFAPFSAEDLDITQRFKAGELTIDPQKPILREGAKAAQLYMVLSGMGLRYKTLSNGRRQVINFIFPGDFIGLQGSVMEEMQQSVESTTDMLFCVFDRASLWQFIKASPERSFDLTWAAAVDEHLVAEALTTVGQQTAESRIAWALVRLSERAERVGLSSGPDETPLPFRQQDLADAMGLSLVHTNKTLRRLLERGYARWSDGVLTVTDRRGLRAAAGLAVDDETMPTRRPLI